MPYNKFSVEQRNRKIANNYFSYYFFLPQMILSYYRFNLLNNVCNMNVHSVTCLELISSIQEQHAKEILCYTNNRRLTEFSVG